MWNMWLECIDILMLELLLHVSSEMCIILDFAWKIGIK